MRCFNCNQYNPMGQIYTLKLKNEYHICSSCIAKAMGDIKFDGTTPPKRVRDRKNFLFYDKVIKRLSEYMPTIFKNDGF